MFEPLGQRVLVEDIAEKYEGRLMIAPTSKEKPTLMSQVVAISAEIISPKLSVGDVIYRGEWSGQIVITDGKQYRVMPIADVIGKLK